MRSIRMAGRYSALVTLTLIIGCGPAATASPAPSAGTPAPTPSTAVATPAPSKAPASPSPAQDPRFAGFSLCPKDRQPGFMVDEWLCGTVDVPFDRADPAAGTIPIAVYVLPHTDTSVPPSEPVFTTPGGPGGPGFENFGVYAFQGPMRAHHDIVTVDPRGTRSSGLIECSELQAGYSSHDELQADVRACADSLKGRTDRYGAADRGMDMEVVREHLGYDQVDWYAPSYGSVDVQAYAARYPDRIRSLVIDAGFTVDDEEMSYWLAPGLPEELIKMAGRQCKRFGFCAAIDPDPEGVLREMIEAVVRKPVTRPGASGEPATVADAKTLALLLGSLAVEPADLISAAKQFRDGSPDALLNLASASQQFLPDGYGPATDFSSGANFAGYCNDTRFAWDRSDSPEVRQRKFDHLIMESDALFAPFTARAWGDAWSIDQCIGWPAPTHFDPVIPPGAKMPDVPTLILAGDADGGLTTEMTRILADRFPKSTTVVVAGAKHPTFERPDACAPTIATHFLETLEPGDTSCADTPP